MLPEVPTLDEQGIKDVFADNWYALFAPAKTPAPVIAKLNAAVTAAMNDPEVNRKLMEAGADPVPGTPAQFADFLKSEFERWGKVIRDKNIKQGRELRPTHFGRYTPVAGSRSSLRAGARRPAARDAVGVDALRFAVEPAARDGGADRAEGPEDQRRHRIPPRA